MAQLFSRTSSFLFTAAVVAAASALLVAVPIFWFLYRSSWWSGVREPIAQPVPFSHQHHAGVLAIDCRYCHTSVERSAYAGMPPVKTCMTCHSQLWTDAAMLAPVRNAYAGDGTLRWRRVHDLPEFVFFNHSIHVSKGIGCETCHGRVDRMPLTAQTASLEMRWCLDCHRNPQRYLRPQAAVFDMAWTPPADQARRGAALMREYHIDARRLSDCTVCHR